MKFVGGRGEGDEKGEGIYIEQSVAGLFTVICL